MTVALDGDSTRAMRRVLRERRVPAARVVILSPTSGAAGRPLTITGTGFGSGEGTGNVTFDATWASPTACERRDEGTLHGITA